MGRPPKDGRRTEAYESVRKELEPVGDSKVPKGFNKDEWSLLPYEDKLDFVRRKKELSLLALQNRVSSPALSLIMDLNELETRMVGQQILDAEDGDELSETYMKALKLKIELAKAIKYLTDKGIIKHEHLVKTISDDDVLDIAGVIQEGEFQMSQDEGEFTIPEDGEFTDQDGEENDEERSQNGSSE